MTDLFDMFEQPPQAVENHHCLACGKAHADERQVALHDGRMVSNYSDAWRLECEARAILAVPRLGDRQDRLKNIEKHRGKLAADQLRETMISVWNARMKEKLPA